MYNTIVSNKKTSSSSLHLGSQLCFALYSTSRALTKVYQALLKNLDEGLTYPQYLVLLALWERDDQSVSALGDALLLDSGTLTPLLKRMEAAGLLMRKRFDTDERSVCVSLSKKGQKLHSKASAIPACLIEASCAPQAELKMLTQRIQKLRAQLIAQTN